VPGVQPRNAIRRLGRRIATGDRLIVAVTGLAVFLVLLVLVVSRWAPLDAFDHQVSAAAHRAAVENGWLRVTARIVTNAGGPIGVDVVAAIAVVVLLIVRRFTDAVIIVVARLGELGTETLTKALVNRARPTFTETLATAGGSSYPSGHAAGSAAFYGTVVLLIGGWAVSRRPRLLVAVVAGIFVLAVAASRVLLGVHYPSDVVGGLGLGLAWAGAATAGLRARQRLGLGCRAGVRRSRESGKLCSASGRNRNSWQRFGPTYRVCRPDCRPM
jgi:undecaprenyl-diphosphatase